MPKSCKGVAADEVARDIISLSLRALRSMIQAELFSAFA
jgi:hypothetical protein